MISRLHPGVLLILLVLLALLTFWVASTIVPTRVFQDDDAYQQPDYIIENLSGVQADHVSATQRNFSAKKLLHFVDSDITHLERPYFLNIEHQKPVIRVKAEQAKLSEDGENIYLTGDVTVLRGEDKGLMTMVTSYLHLIPDENIAKTDKTVVLSRKNTTINAIGLELDNDVGIIHLLSRVRATDSQGASDNSGLR